jgi:integrase
MGCVLQNHAPTIAACIDRYQRDGMSSLAPRTQQNYRRHLDQLRRDFGTMGVPELTPRVLAGWMDVPKGKIQRNRQLAVLSAVLTKAVRRYFLAESNPCRDVDRHPSKPRDRLVSDEEYAAWRAVAPLRVQLMMDLAIRTGQRQGDLLDLQWSAIRDNEIHFQQSKTGKRLAIEINPEIEAVLDRCWLLPNGGKDGGIYVVTRSRGGRYTSEGFRALHQRVMNKCMRRGVLKIRATFHDLRAVAATKCKTMEEAMHLLGHSNISMTRRVYRRGIERVKALSLAA